MNSSPGPTTTQISVSSTAQYPFATEGRVLLLCGEGKPNLGAVEQLRWRGLEVRVTSSSLVALGLIVDFDPEVLWIESTDGDVSIDEILDALVTPRLVRPISIAISMRLNAESPNLDLSQADEVLDLVAIGSNPAQLMQLIKVTRLERQIIQRENEILNSLPHALLVLDRQLILWKVNTQVEKLLEIYDSNYRKNALGRPFGVGLAAAGLPYDVDTPLPKLVHELERSLQNGRGRFRVKEIVGGAERLFSGEITRLVHSPDHYLIDLRDITADEQAVLVEARRERLATIGNLSVGVAHEIQNPNTFSRVNAANLKMMVEAIKPILSQAAAATGGKLGNMPAETFVLKMSEAVGAVDMASRRIEAVLTTLKAFGRQDDGHLDAINIKTVVDEAVMLVKHETRGKCEMDVDVAEDLPLVTASATGLSQVLVNLLQNSVQAFGNNSPQGHGPDGARITIRTEAVNQDEIILSVSDNGPGIPENLQEKIFRPYFTTKPQGQGTGLGLSISSDMLHRFGGDLTLRSRAGEGATFYIKLRRHDEPSAHS